MLKAIKYNLANLLLFDGRNDRPTFWFYVLFLFLCQIAITIIAIVPVMVSAFADIMQEISSGADPEQAGPVMAARMGELMGQQVWISAGLNAAMMLLLVASFVRRLHDAGFSGYWAVPAVLAQLAAIWMSFEMVDDIQRYMDMAMDPDRIEEFMAQQQQMSIYSLVGWIGPLIVIVFGVFKSTDGPNPYGDAPDRL